MRLGALSEEQSEGKGYSPEVTSCVNGCGHGAFGNHHTCCTRCKGADGPHAKDCEAKSEFTKTTSTWGDDCGGTVMIRVIKAKLDRSFDAFGKMDPFCKVEWLECSGRKAEVGRTKSDWGGHMTPQWDHMCRAMPYSGRGGGDMVTFTVSEENFGGMGKPTLCGEVTSRVDELLVDAALVSDGVITTPPKHLTLVKKSAATGSITVEVVYTRKGVVRLCSSGQYTSVDSSLFVTPVKRLGVSGGTAPFFSLELKSLEADKSVGYWIGKDLSHATDEISFYEERQALSLRGGHGLEKVFGFMFEYAGVLRCAEVGAASGSQELELLVLQNLRNCCKNLRMLDIKVGEKTAAANWQGKSRFAAMKQSLVDGFTNSAVEGYRLEGFDGPPPALQSIDPLLYCRFGLGDGAARKAKRMMLQQFNAAEMFMSFYDVHQTPDETGISLDTTLCSIELAEIVAAEIAIRLVGLANACRLAPVPQKWIGSSVALGFDDQTLPSRGTPKEQIVSTVCVYIFDWGRSELNTLERHTALSAAEQSDRKLFWKYYSGGIDRLAWEASRFFWHRFCNVSDWSEVIIKVFDFDTSTDNDFIGEVRVPLKPVPETNVPLRNSSGNPVLGADGKPSMLSYMVAWRDLPNSRLKGAWRIGIVKAANLPVCDILSGSSDPFVVVNATSKDSSFKHCQQTAVFTSELNPAWNETFDLPLSAGVPLAFDRLLGNLTTAHPVSPQQGQSISSSTPYALFPSASADMSSMADQVAFENWVLRLGAVAGSRSFNSCA